MVDSHHPWCVPCYGHLFLYWSKPKCYMVVQHEGLRPPRFWDSLEQVSETHASGWQSWASFDPPMTYDGRILTLRKGYSADHRTLETKEKAYDTMWFAQWFFIGMKCNGHCSNFPIMSHCSTCHAGPGAATQWVCCWHQGGPRCHKSTSGFSLSAKKHILIILMSRY